MRVQPFYLYFKHWFVRRNQSGWRYSSLKGVQRISTCALFGARSLSATSATGITQRRAMGFFSPTKSPKAASSKPAAAGKPLHLLQYDERTKKFELGAEALDALRKIRGDVGVLAVCGRARQGKSYILNQLCSAGNESGFKVGPTVRPCTKGLWIWSAPIERIDPVTGKRFHVILLDTEGIDAYDQTGQYSTQIFSMAVLLSSLFCYNQMGGIDEAALDRLSLVTEMTKHIRVRSEGNARSDAHKGKGTNVRELGTFSPSFVWLLRDFYLDLDDPEHGGYVTAADYLESALRNVSTANGNKGAEAKNAIRESIRGLFPERECFPLVRPVNDEKQLRQLDTVPRSELRPEFRAGLDSLLDLLFERCRPKSVGADVLNGPALAAMATQYVAAINDGAVPAIATAWQSVAESECAAAVEEGEADYVEQFYEAADDTPMDEAKLSVCHAQAIEHARSVFDARAVGNPETRAAAYIKLERALQGRYREYRERRVAAASARCSELLAAASTRVMGAANAPDASIDSVLARIDSEVETYLAEADGPSAHERLGGFLRDAAKFAVGALATKALSASRSECAMERQKAESATASARELEQRVIELDARVREMDARARSAETRASSEADARRVAEKAAADADAARREEASHAREDAAKAALALQNAHNEFKMTEVGATQREGSLREAFEAERARAEAAANDARRAERELAAARADSTALRAARDSSASQLEKELTSLRARLGEAERAREGAESAARDARAKASAADSDARAHAAAKTATAETARRDAERRAAEAEKRAAYATTRLEELRKSGELISPARKSHGSSDDLMNAWRAEAEAKSGGIPAAPGPETTETGKPTPLSPSKRRREKSPTPIEEEPEFVDAVEAPAEGAGEPEPEGDLREEAAAMTVAQLKHKLQTMGLAHLYAGKRGVKKADLVNMYVDGEEGGN